MSFVYVFIQWDQIVCLYIDGNLINYTNKAIIYDKLAITHTQYLAECKKVNNMTEAAQDFPIKEGGFAYVSSNSVNAVEISSLLLYLYHN